VHTTNVQREAKDEKEKSEQQIQHPPTTK